MDELHAIKPGLCVINKIGIPAHGSSPAIPSATFGRVIRLVHIRVEGEPLSHGRMDEIIAHVRFNDIESVYPISVELLQPAVTQPSVAFRGRRLFVVPSETDKP